MTRPEPEPPGPSGSAGFTLLEMLVSLVLLGFLLVGLAQGFHFGLALWGRQDAEISRVEGFDAVDRGLRRVIAVMEPGTPLRSLLRGEPDKMSFVSALPGAQENGARADMMLVRAQNGQLLLRWRLHRHERSSTSPPDYTDTVLLDGLRRLDIAYWQAPAPPVPGGWSDSWSRPGIPALVRLRLVFDEHDTRHWPDIFIAPMRTLATP
jgi:general secretion pathway protein J